jgi:type IV pilus assembly protein PilN
VRVAINLASRPFADIAPALKTTRIAMGVLTLVALGLLLGLRALHGKAEAARARDHALDGKIAKVRQEQQRYQAMMRQPDNARTLEQAENLNRLFDEKAFSWTLAMEDLERVLPAGVQVQTLEPTVKNGQISVRLRVLGPRDKDVELVQNLEHSRHFVLPRIVGESAENAGGANQRPQPVSASSRMDFDILADYSPGTSEERKLAKEKAESAKAHAAEESQTEPKPGVRPPYTGMPRPKAPVQPHRGVPR